VDYVFNLASPASPPEYMRLRWRSPRGTTRLTFRPRLQSVMAIHSNTRKAKTIGAMSIRWVRVRCTTSPSGLPRRW
jgi:hypothetical protein